jgi:hypothetical protein
MRGLVGDRVHKVGTPASALAANRDTHLPLARHAIRPSERCRDAGLLEARTLGEMIHGELHASVPVERHPHCSSPSRDRAEEGE